MERKRSGGCSQGGFPLLAIEIEGGKAELIDERGLTQTGAINAGPVDGCGDDGSEHGAAVAHDKLHWPAIRKVQNLEACVCPETMAPMPVSGLCARRRRDCRL